MCRSRMRDRRYVDAGFQRISAAQAQVSQRADGLVLDDTGVVENLLEFGGCRRTLLRCQVRLGTQVNRVEGGVGIASQLVGRSGSQRIDGFVSLFGGVAAAEDAPCAYHGQVLGLHHRVLRESLREILGEEHGLGGIPGPPQRRGRNRLHISAV
jgi:hypothetical protein